MSSWVSASLEPSTALQSLHGRKWVSRDALRLYQQIDCKSSAGRSMFYKIVKLSHNLAHKRLQVKWVCLSVLSDDSRFAAGFSSLCNFFGISPQASAIAPQAAVAPFNHDSDGLLFPDSCWPVEGRGSSDSQCGFSTKGKGSVRMKPCRMWGVPLD